VWCSDRGQTAVDAWVTAFVKARATGLLRKEGVLLKVKRLSGAEAGELRRKEGGRILAGGWAFYDAPEGRRV